MAYAEDQAPRSHRLLAVGAVALLAGVAAASFGRVFIGRGATEKLVLAAVASVGVAALLERRNALLAVLVSAAGLLVAVGLLVFPHTTLAGLPTRRTLSAIGNALRAVGRESNVQAAPTPPLAALFLAAVAAVWAAGFSAHALAIRAGSPFLAALPPAALVGFTGMVLDAGPRPFYAALFLLGVLAVLFADGLRRVRQWGPLRPWPSIGRHRLTTAATTRGAWRVTTVAVVIASAVPWILPGYRAGAFLNLSNNSSGGLVAVDPLVSVSASLKMARPVEVFRVRAGAPSYWRLIGLDRFDGDTWSAGDPLATGGVQIQGSQVLPGLAFASADSPGTRFQVLNQEVAIERLASGWLPLAFPPSALTLGTGAVRYDPTSGTAVAPQGLSPGYRYDVTSTLVEPRAQQLDAVTQFSDPALRGYEQLPATTPQEIFTIAHRWTDTEPTAFRKLLAIQDHLRSFTYDATVSGRSDSNFLLTFLTRTHRGFCQQFASAMAVLARALGLPARVAVGFTEGTKDADGVWHVQSSDAHAWVEVLFPGYGWIAFEPTPTRTNPVADAYLVNLSPLVTSCAPGTVQIISGCPTGRAQNTTQTPESRTALDRLTHAEGFDKPGAPSRAGAIPVARRRHPRSAPTGTILAIVGLVLLAALVLFPAGKAVRRRLSLRGNRPPRELALAAFRVFESQAADAGLGRRGGETLSEYRSRLRGEVEFSNGHLDRLTRLAGRAAYAPGDVSREEAEEAVSAARTAIGDVRRGRPLARRLAGLWGLPIRRD